MKTIKHSDRAILPLKIMLVVALFCILGLVGAKIAQAEWSSPVSPPPGGNVAAPINVSGSAQTKQGSLTVGGEYLYVNTGNLFFSQSDKGLFWSDLDDSTANPHIEHATDVLYVSPGENAGSKITLQSGVVVTNAGLNPGEITIDNSGGKILIMKSNTADAGSDIKSTGAPLYINYDDGAGGQAENVYFGNVATPTRLCLNDPGDDSTCIASWATGGGLWILNAAPDPDVVYLDETATQRNVGVGTQLAQMKLHIAGEVGQGILLEDTTNSKLTYLTNENGWFQINAGGGNGVKIISDGATETLVIDDNKVGIGTDAPNEALEIDSGVANASGVRFTNLTSASPGGVGSGTVLSVDANGNVVLVNDAGGGTDVLVKTKAGDSNAGYLYDPLDIGNNKLVAGANVTLTEVDQGAGYYGVQISSTGGSGLWEGTAGNNINPVTPAATKVRIGWSGAGDATQLSVINTSDNSAIYGQQSGTGYSGYFSGKFAIVGSGNKNLRLEETSGGEYFDIDIDTSGDFNILNDASTNVFAIEDATGDVGINDGSPSYKLDVNGDVNVQTGFVYRHNGVAGASASPYCSGNDNVVSTITVNGGIVTDVTCEPDDGGGGGVDTKTVKVSGTDSADNFLLSKLTSSDASILVEQLGGAGTNQAVNLRINGTGFGLWEGTQGDNINPKTPNTTKVRIGWSGAGDNTQLAVKNNSINSAIYGEQSNWNGYAAYFSGLVGIRTYQQLGTDSGGNTYIGGNIKYNGSEYVFVNPSGAYNGGGGNPSRGTRIGMTSVITFLTGEGNFGGDTNPHLAERLRITNDGKVGIGTPSPQAKLAVYGNTDPSIILIQNSGSGSGSADGLEVSYHSNQAYLWNYELGNLYMGSGNTEAVRINNSGNVRIASLAGSSCTGDYTVDADANGYLICAEDRGGGSTGIDGSGTANYISKFIDSDTIGNSRIFDNGTQMGFGTNNPQTDFHFVGGQIRLVNNGHELKLGISDTDSRAHIDVAGNGWADSIWLGDVSNADNDVIVMGDLGVGESSPVVKLHAEGYIRSENGSYGVQLAQGGQGSGPQINFGSAGTPTSMLSLGAWGAINNLYTASRDFKIYSEAASTIMYIEEGTGDIGLDTTDPSAKLHINEPSSGVALKIGTNSTYELEFTGGNGANIYSGSSDLYILAGASKDVRIGANNANDQLVVHDNGNVEIENTLYIHDSDNQIYDSSGNLYIRTNSTAPIFMLTNSSERLGILRYGGVRIPRTTDSNWNDQPLLEVGLDSAHYSLGNTIESYNNSNDSARYNAVSGYKSGTSRGSAVYGELNGVTCSSGNCAAIYGSDGTGGTGEWAGYFDGPVNITGDITWNGDIYYGAQCPPQSVVVYTNSAQSNYAFLDRNNCYVGDDGVRKSVTLRAISLNIGGNDYALDDSSQHIQCRHACEAFGFEKDSGTCVSRQSGSGNHAWRVTSAPIYWQTSNTNYWCQECRCYVGDSPAF